MCGLADRKSFVPFCLPRRSGPSPTQSGSTLTKALRASWNVNGWSETGFALAILVSHKMATVSGHQGQFVNWHTAYPAEAVASGASSASCQDGLEDVGILPVIVAELKFGQVQRQILLADIVIRAHNTTFQKRPERFDVLSVNLATNILALTVAHNFMLWNEPITGMLVCRNKVNLVRNNLAHKSAHGEQRNRKPV